MFDVGGGELVLIFIAVLLLFGPKKIPEVMRSVGKGLRQFRQAQDDLKDQLRDISTEVERSVDIRTVQPVIPNSPPNPEPDISQIEQDGTEKPTANYVPPVPRQKHVPSDEAGNTADIS